MVEESRPIVVARLQGQKADESFEYILTDDAGKLLVWDPKLGSLISFSGTTTSDGAGDGSTLICSDLATEPDFNGNLVIIKSGDYAGQARDINGATTGGTVTPASAFSGRIVEGTEFVIVGIRTVPAEVAALQADVGDASASTLGSLYAILGDPAQSFLAMLGYEGALSLANKLTAARAALLDQITAARMQELDAANIPADIDLLLTRITAAVALAADLTTHDVDIKALLVTIAAYIDTEVAAILAAVDTEVAAIEAKLDNGASGLAAIVAEIDANETKIDALEAKLDTGGLGVGLVTKALTFANNNGQVPLFTVTGDVLVRIVAIVKTGCATGTACNVSVGIAAIVDAMIPVTDITLLAAGEIWHDVTPDKEIEALSSMREYIVANGADITLNSSAADNSGVIAFYCFWTPLSTGATVVAA